MKWNLKNHIVNRHSNEQKYKCTWCDYKTLYKADFVDHQRIHNNTIKTKCTNCRSSIVRPKYKGILCMLCNFIYIILNCNLFCMIGLCRLCADHIKVKDALLNFVQKKIRHYNKLFKLKCDYAVVRNNKFKFNMVLDFGCTCEVKHNPINNKECKTCKYIVLHTSLKQLQFLKGNFIII